MILPINSQYRLVVNEYIRSEWNGPIVVSKGIAYDTSDLNGFVSVDNDKLSGYILYSIKDTKCEILVLQSIKENCGIGRALINAVINIAKDQKCSCVWLTTTNDNIHAIRYYQKFGFELIAVHINALNESRKLKPSIPLFGNDNIPIKHEFEFSYTV